MCFNSLQNYNYMDNIDDIVFSRAFLEASLRCPSGAKNSIDFYIENMYIHEFLL